MINQNNEQKQHLILSNIENSQAWLHLAFATMIEATGSIFTVRGFMRNNMLEVLGSSLLHLLAMSTLIKFYQAHIRSATRPSTTEVQRILDARVERQQPEFTAQQPMIPHPADVIPFNQIAERLQGLIGFRHLHAG